MKRAIAISERRQQHHSQRGEATQQAEAINYQPVIEALNAVLCDEYVLYTKTRNYHWNVTGPQFHDYHKFFEHQYEELDKFVDDVAEQARSCGGWAFGTLEEFKKNARVSEQAGEHPNARQMLSNLLSDHETVMSDLRDALRAADSDSFPSVNNFLADLMVKHQKMAWMLRACLDKQ